MLPIPATVLELLSSFRVPAQAYIVGGAARDLLNGDEPRDWDIAVGGYANNEELKYTLKASRKTRLGGCEITLEDGVQCDVWRIEDTVLGSDIKTITQLLDSVTFNVNAVALNVFNGQEFWVNKPAKPHKILAYHHRPDIRKVDHAHLTKMARYAVVKGMLVAPDVVGDLLSI